MAASQRIEHDCAGRSLARTSAPAADAGRIASISRAVASCARSTRPAELREASAPSGARHARRVRARAGPAASRTARRPAAARRRLARQRVEIGEVGASRVGVARHDLAAATSARCASVLPSGVEQVELAGSRVAAQFEAADERVRRRRSGLDAKRQAARRGLAGAAGRRPARTRRAGGERRREHAQPASAPRAARAAPITARRAGAPASPAACRCRRRASAPSRQTRARLSRWPVAHSTSPRWAAISGSGARLVGAAQQAQRLVALPMRYSTQPRLSVMNGSPGRSSSAFWISARASGRRIVALGERVAERVVGVLVVGLERDHPAQQALHLVEAVELLGHHRLVVEQVGVVGNGLVRLRQHLVRPRVHACWSRSSCASASSLARRVARRCSGTRADQLARFVRSCPGARASRRAAAAPRARAAGCRSRASQRFGAGEVLLLLGRLREQQVGLRQRRARVGRRVVVVVAACVRRARGGAEVHGRAALDQANVVAQAPPPLRAAASSRARARRASAKAARGRDRCGSAPRSRPSPRRSAARSASVRTYRQAHRRVVRLAPRAGA